MKKIIIDTDPGVDDFLALVMLLLQKDIQIEAITCVHGNTSLENASLNIAYLLKLLNRKDILVYKGAKEALLPLFQSYECTYHGSNGLMGIDIPKNVDISMIQKQSAVERIYKIVADNPNEISLICLGPLTNIALALKTYPDFSAKIKEVWIMGGNFKGIGNITAQAEFNFYADPEAAFIVLENLKCKTYIVPWETTLKKQIPLSWRWSLPKEDDREIFKVTDQMERLFFNKPELKLAANWNLCDPTIVAAFLDPDKIITEMIERHVSVELNGHYTRGQMVIDHLEIKKPNVFLIKKIDDEEFKKMYINIRNLK